MTQLEDSHPCWYLCFHLSFTLNTSLNFSNSHLLSSCPKRGTVTWSFCHLVPSFTGCWNSKRRQPDTSTSVHLYIDGFSCHYQLMLSASMFVPIILFHDHMILFSDSPLFSLPSFLHDSLTTRFRIFPVPLYLVMFVSCPSDVVPHLSATSEVSYFIYMILHPISY